MIEIDLLLHYVEADLGRYSETQAPGQPNKLAKLSKPNIQQLRRPPEDDSPGEDIEVDLEAAEPVETQELPAGKTSSAPAEAGSKSLEIGIMKMLAAMLICES